MQHHFDTEIAKEYGVNIAIFLDNMAFWTRTNASNKQNLHEDRYWSYGTPEFFANYFPYWKPRLIKDIIKKCKDEGLLLKNNFNKKGYDRTSWYALSDKALIALNLDRTCLKPAETLIGRKTSYPLDVKRTMDETKNVRPIPDTKPDTKPDNKSKEKINKKESELIMQDNPHAIPIELIEEWGAIRNKPITARVWNKTNKVMGQLGVMGLKPLEAFEYMLERQWQGMEVRYFSSGPQKNVSPRKNTGFETSRTSPFLNKGIV